MPLFEAVVNSIQAIEEANEGKSTSLDEFNVDVEIARHPQSELELKRGAKPEKDIIAFRVTDNGIGFDDENFKSFSTLDTLKKVDKGCRGIGRLLWLKAFNRVSIDSVYRSGDQLLRRKFYFDAKTEVSEPETDLDGKATVQTVVELLGFDPKFASSGPKTLETIAQGLLEHCLWYFVRKEGVPTIKIHDGADTVDLFDLYDEYMHSSAKAEAFEIKGYAFEITHVKIRATKKQNHTLGYCAAGRLVREESLRAKVPGLFSAISDDAGDFIYMAYLTGEFLDAKAVGERTGFNIQEEAEGLFADKTVSYSDMRNAIYPRIEDFIGESLKQNIQAGKEKLEKFVTTVAPKYRPLLSHIPESKLQIDPLMSDKDLDMHLHREVFQVEQAMLSEGHEIMTPRPGESIEDYEKRLEEYLQTASDLKKSDLANYVTHRRVIIDLLAAAVNIQPDGKYSKEDLIHDLIVPMRITSDDVEFKRQNLWLLDERLAFHNFLASDKPLSANPTTSNNSGKEPDVASLRVFENPLLVGDQGQQHASITVVEIKRPMRKGYVAGTTEEKDPILQALNYLRRLREGAETKNGRPIPNADKIPGFVYVIADFTSHLMDCCKLHQLQITADGMGYFGYHRDQSYNAYIQVLSFDGLVKAATERNKAFFDTLGLPSR